MNSSRTMLCLGLGFFACLFVGNVAFSAKAKLIAPWYLLQAQLSAALEADPCVKVQPLLEEDDVGMEIKILVCNDVKAQALAAFLSKPHPFSDALVVKVNIYGSNAEPIEAALPDSIEATSKLLSQALHGNPYFIKTGIGTNPMAQPAAYAVFKPVVIQYFSDDISDWYQNTNVIAAKIFSDLFNLHPFDADALSIFATTAPMRTEA